MTTEAVGAPVRGARSSWGTRLVLLCLPLIGIGAAIGVVEGAFRLLYQPPVVWNDRPAEYYIPEGATFLTDRDYPAVKAPGTFRIAVVGDSFSFGPYLQYDDTFAKRLERWLNLNRDERPVEVINYGVPRYSTSHEVAVTEKALAAGADLVLLQITLNDPEIKPYRPTSLIVDEETGQSRLESGVYRHWRSLAWVRTRLENAESHRRYVRYFFRLFENRRTWENFRSPLGGIVGRCRKAGVPIVAVVFPLFGHPVNEEYPFRPIHEKVAGLLESLAVPHLDLTDAYRDMPLDRLQVIPIADRHPNEIGHRIAAEQILIWLRGLALLPEGVFPRFVVPNRIGTEPPAGIGR